MSELSSQIKELQTKVAEIGRLLDLPQLRKELRAEEEKMSRPDFWSDQNKARGVSQKVAGLREEIVSFERLEKEIGGLEEMTRLAEEEGVELGAELIEKYHALEKQMSAMEFRLLFGGPYDAHDAILSIHAGAGGTEAQDWTEMLARMYGRYAEHRGFETQVLDESRGSEAGIKSITVRIRGRYAYGFLKSEAGVHRLVRISPFDAEKMRHTSFALVEVLPELEDIPEIQIDPKDLRLDTFLSSGHGGQSVQTTYSAVRIVHLPTGITVSCQNERSQQQNKETALKILKAKLHQKYLTEQEEKKREIRGKHVAMGWGNQIRSYVLHPYQMVKDHRTKFETSDTGGVLDGSLDGLVEAYLKWKVKTTDF
ncbi:peptide chain release factor 2 [Candidatus Uhrbacteria bacterium]|nr:peptide chain release factor 2 [Candidatus Uhrbacteria bacterium]